MPSETTARAEQSQPPAPDEGDYQAFCAAVSASARGRAFLAEYARRNRNADTEALLTAIERLQSVVTATARREPAHAEPTPQADTTPAFTNATADEVDRTHLIVVPAPEQPELPIPSPAAIQPPAIALVRDETIMAEVSFVQPSPTPAAPTIQRAPHTVEVPRPDLTISEVSGVARPLPPSNPLASIMALSEEERLALFT